MTVEEFAGFWSRQGCRTAKGAGTFWYAVHRRVFLSLPYDRPVQPTRLELLRLFSLTPALVLRYPSKPSCPWCAGGAFVCERKGYDLDALHQKARNQTRKGLRECALQRIEFGVLAEIGYHLNEDTWQRQERNETGLTPQHWRQYCQAAADTPDMEAWGVFFQGRLAAFAVCAVVERCCHILYQSSSRRLLQHCPNNALVFSVTKRALQQPAVDLVCYGLKSVEQTPGLEHFKLRMGFSIRPFDDLMVLHPLLHAFLALGGRLAVEWAWRRHPESDYWRKALVLCRLGRHPTRPRSLATRPWPLARPSDRLKRAFDITFAALGLAALSPLFLLLALAIKLSDAGPVFFRQLRVGQGGKAFFILKFRSMAVDAQEAGPRVTRNGDPRITRLGRFLRKFKLDELPQLWNVLIGQMSFVGPRPEVPGYVEKYTPSQRRVLALKPGITDAATLDFRHEEDLLQQRVEDGVEQFYIEHCLPRKIELSLAYAARANVRTDLVIILRTLLPFLNRSAGGEGPRTTR
jgi:lipopolysaccharide/colanic/teichoic acid biosynthesis glycosyltransferase